MVARKQIEFICYRFCRPNWDDESVGSVFNDVRAGGMRSRNHRRSLRHRFKNNQTEPFKERRQNEHIAVLHFAQHSVVTQGRHPTIFSHGGVEWCTPGGGFSTKQSQFHRVFEYLDGFEQIRQTFALTKRTSEQDVLSTRLSG